LIPDLIEAGVEILSAMQPLAFEIDSAESKKQMLPLYFWSSAAEK